MSCEDFLNAMIPILHFVNFKKSASILPSSIGFISYGFRSLNRHLSKRGIITEMVPVSGRKHAPFIRSKIIYM